MIEASGLATLMLASLAQATFVAGATWLALRNAAAGGARQRLRFATIAFYGAALLPLAMRLPHELSLTVGPDAASLATLRAPLLGNAGDAIDALSLIALAIVALVVVVRLGRTFVAAVRGEKLVRSAYALPSEDFGLPRHIRIARSDAVQGPCVAGLFKPTILLPARLEHAAPRFGVAVAARIASPATQRRAQYAAATSRRGFVLVESRDAVPRALAQ